MVNNCTQKKVAKTFKNFPWGDLRSKQWEDELHNTLKMKNKFIQMSTTQINFFSPVKVTLKAQGKRGEGRIT